MNNPNSLNNPSDLADLIDSLMQQGSGHVNISVSEKDGGLNVSTTKSTDCSGNKGACCQPTELLDDDDDDF